MPPPTPAPVQQQKKKNRSLTDSSGRAIPDRMLVTSDPTGASRKLDFSGGEVREPRKRGRPKQLIKNPPKPLHPHGPARAPRASGWRKWVRGTDFLDSTWEVTAAESSGPMSPPPAMELATGVATPAAAAPGISPPPSEGPPKLVIRLRRAVPVGGEVPPPSAPSPATAPGYLSSSQPPASHLSYSQNSESSMWSERSDLMVSSYSLHTGGGDDSLPPLALSLPPSLPVNSTELSLSTMSMAMPPSAPEMHPQPELLTSIDPTPASPPIVLEDSSAAAEISSFFAEQDSSASTAQRKVVTTVITAETTTTAATASATTTEEMSVVVSTTTNTATTTTTASGMEDPQT